MEQSSLTLSQVEQDKPICSEGGQFVMGEWLHVSKNSFVLRLTWLTVQWPIPKHTIPRYNTIPLNTDSDVKGWEWSEMTGLIKVITNFFLDIRLLGISILWFPKPAL